MDYLAIAWKDTIIPRMEDLQGRFGVEILSGPFKLLVPAITVWEKQIDRNEGYNIINGKETGRFVIYQTLALPEEDSMLELNYDRNQEPKYWKRMRDEMRMVEPGIFLGKIWMKILGKRRFMGYFSLNRAEEISLVDIAQITTWDVNEPATLFAFLADRWTFAPDSFVYADDRYMTLATGMIPKNEALLAALKSNRDIWNRKIIGVIKDGYYRFCFPATDEVSPC